jgi:hypothetical protein
MMKRILLLLLIALLPLYSQEVKKEAADPLKDLHCVDQVAVVPEHYKAGYDSISLKDSEAFLRFIASDWLEGRDTGSAGYAIAGEFAAALFASWGYEPAGDLAQQSFRGMFGFMSDEKAPAPKRSYFQAVTLREKMNETTRLSFRESHGSVTKILNPAEQIDFTLQTAAAMDLDAPIVFAGYGLDLPEAAYNDFQGIDVKGKVVLILEGKPENAKGGKRLTEMQKALSETNSPMRRRMVSNQIKAAQKAGALAVISVHTDTETWLNSLRPMPKQSDSKPIFDRRGRSISLALDEGMSMPWEIVPRLKISPQLADQLLKPYGQTVSALKNKIDEQLKPRSFLMDRTRVHMVREIEEKPLQCRNVLAFMEGSDPELKKEVVVIGAHLDHLGKIESYIFNGADDNGSGAVVVLQTAKAMMMNPVKPKRSVLFALWTGEEKGLLGSRFYVSHPYKSLKVTHAYLNIDMASRLWDKGSLGRMARMMRVENADQLLEKIDISKFVSFSHYEHPTLGEQLRKSNQYVGLNMLLRPTKDSMGGSDHWPFGNAGVPWVFFGAAMTEDYHQPSDEVERCSFDLMQAFGRMCYLTVAQLTGI